ncbi:MFS transporter, DHA1 family, bicyclomycin/chloramphenicol resistance protein [Granulicella pectinivorans]|uniref:MFS transporter, DHA1 family, bicyclomycin/chloramphenicol resistance protein n=1 Tax=Granulicella pectinivorans TaxID=474950 RepID=A0A1I6LCB7_9BACT|nr:multidrug effflux MFS transporter [Granulicella pectinivorans]SFS01116.1 MFS transporter, DHA1 family, bicyclomycin/chloramphenicol resistance protein [Granulicella pectinivorans]
MKKHSIGFSLLLAAISALTSLAIDMGLPAMPVIEAQFHLLPGRGSLTLAVFLAGFAFTPLVGGPVSDRFGRRPVLLGGLAVFAASALGCTVVPNFATLLLFRVLQGASAGVCVALPMAIIRDSLSGHAARQAMSQMTTILGVVPVFAPVMGSWVLLVAPWRVIYAVQAGLALGILLAVSLFFGETHPGERRQALPARALLTNYGLLLKEPIFVVHATIYACTYACIFSYVSASPVVFMDQMGVPQHIYTLIFGAISACQIVGALSSGLLARKRLPLRMFLRVGLVMMCAGGLVLFGLQVAGLARPVMFVAPTMLMMVAFGFMAPSLMLGSLEPIPHVAGAGSGAIRCIQMLFGSGASGLLAWGCARPGVNPAIATAGTMALLAIAALGLYAMTQTKRIPVAVKG